MQRSVFLPVVALVLAITVGYGVVQRANQPAAQQPVVGVQPVAHVGPGAAERARPAAARKPSEPLILNRWALHSGQRAPDDERGIRVAIEPSGPWVVTQTSVWAVGWNAVTGQSRTMTPIEPETTLHRVTKDTKWFTQIRNRHSGKTLLELQEAPTRDACLTPDWERLIVIGRPAIYPGYQVVNLQGGYWHPEEAFKNVRLFDIATGEKLGELGLKEHGIDDDVWAVAPAADGRSFFVVNPQELLQLSFAAAFGVEAAEE